MKMTFPDDLVKEVVYKLKYSWPEVSAANFTAPQDGMLQEMVHFIPPHASDCLLAAHISKEKIAPKCFPIDPRQDGCFGFCSNE